MGAAELLQFFSMVVARFYHIVINLIIPGFLSFKRGKYLKGSLLMFVYCLGIDAFLLASTGFIPREGGLLLGFILSFGAWSFSQWGCFRGLIRSGSDRGRGELENSYRKGLKSYLLGDLQTSKRAFKKCRQVDPFSVSAQFLSGVIERDLHSQGDRFFESASDMANAANWKWFIARSRKIR